VALEVSHLGDRDGKMLLHFEVRDSGIGLGDEAVAKLFQPFTQADSSTTRKFGGTGLGLSIVKRLVDLMGGKVGVSSRLGEGSTFWFTLPLEAVAPVSASAVRMNQTLGKHILVVDDNHTNRQVLSRQLEHLGYEVSLADSGATALRELQQPHSGHPPEVLLTDFQMPDMDGAMLAAKIKADPALPPLRLVLLTSLDRQGDPQHCSDMGFAAYLTKPVRTRELRDCLLRVLTQESSEASGRYPALLTRSALREQTSAERFIGRVLVVDDNVVNQKVASRFLERMGLEVTVASDGTEAVKLYEAGTFTVVFMDLQMPFMDGYEATRRIRDFEAWRSRTPIVALTANAMSGQLERCLAAGMDGLLTKPIQVEKLRETVATYCEKTPMPAGPHTLDGATTAALLENPAQSHEAELDIRQLRITTGGDSDFMRELILLYLQSSRQIMNDIQAALARVDSADLCRNAHKLKGASAGIHARHVAQLCEALEKNALGHQPEEIASQVQRLEQALESLGNELQRFLSSDQSAA
jgi:CheY-like chemotaxis protein